MKTTFNSKSGKRRVNLMLNEDLVVQVCSLTNNLSGLFESLLADYLEHERQQRLAKAKTV